MYDNPVVTDIYKCFAYFAYCDNILKMVSLFNNKLSGDLVMRFIELYDNVLKFLLPSVIVEKLRTMIMH